MRRAIVLADHRQATPAPLLRASRPLRPVGDSPISRAFSACASAQNSPPQSHPSPRLDTADPSAGDRQRGVDLGLHSTCGEGSEKRDRAREKTQVTAGPGRAGEPHARRSVRRPNKGGVIGASTGAVVGGFPQGRSRLEKPKKLDAVADRITGLTEEETNGSG